MNDNDLSVALQAAWETHKKVIPRRPEIPFRSDWIIDPESLREFVNVYSKRVGSEPPKWWHEMIVDCDVFPNSHHAFLKFVPGSPLRSKNLEVSNDSAEIDLEAKSGRLKVLRTVFEKAATEGEAGVFPVVLCEKEKSYFARPAVRGYPYKLACVEIKSGKLLWVASIWADRRGDGGKVTTGAGHGIEPVEIRRVGDMVVLYGSGFGLYAEGFDIDSGRNRFRFCTNYWYNPSEAWLPK